MLQFDGERLRQDRVPIEVLLFPMAVLKKQSVGAKE
jgi:hypothetical protein